MQRSERRCSILKKRRSRSLSPKSPKEQAARRASRRISFSGKHNVREFFGNENTAIVWGETYDVSTEKHVLSNEQITLQSTRLSSMSTTLQTTRNDSTAMDISSVVPPSTDVLKIPSFRPSLFRQPKSYSEDQKENIMMKDDSEMELSLIMAPPSKPAPMKSIFASSLKPSLFNFASKEEKIETPPVAERTSGSDNMEISGIEPTTVDDHTQPTQTVKSQGNTYTNWVQQNILKAKVENSAHRRTTNQVSEMNLDTSHIIESPIISQIKQPSSRVTINEPSEMSFEMKPKQEKPSKIFESPMNMSLEMPTEKVRTTRRQTITRAEDMETSPLTSTKVQQSILTQEGKSSQSTSRRTINEPLNISLEDADESKANQCGYSTHTSIQYLPEEKRLSRRQTVHQLKDMDIEVSPMATSLLIQSENPRTIHQPQDMTIDDYSNLSKIKHGITEVSVQYLTKEKQSSHRQTTHKVQDISFDTPTTESSAHHQDLHQLKDMSLDIIQQTDSPAMRSNYSNYKKATPATNRMTINEIKDMSFDSNATCKSNAYSRNNKTILADMSMDLQLTEPYPQNRKSVICKSPNKNATKVFDQSSLEYTKAIDQNVSYHPFHSTKLIDTNCSRFTEVGFDETVDASFVADEKHEVPVRASAPLKRSVQIFNQASNQINRGIRDLEMCEDSPIPTSKKFNLNKTPYYAGLDKENELLETMRISDTSSLDLTSNSPMEKVALDKKETAACATMLYHETIKDDSQLDGGNGTLAEPIEISDDSIKSIRPETAFSSLSTKRKTCFDEISMAVEPKSRNNSTRLSIPNQSLFQLSSMESPIQNDESISGKLSSHVVNMKRLTMNNSLTESPYNFGNISNGAEESKQLTFIEDDEDEDQICNTKIDLAISFENSELHDSVDRKCESFGAKSHEFSRFSIHSEASMMSDVGKPFNENMNEKTFDAPATSITEELRAFKKSSRLRHSHAFDGNDTANTNRSENTLKDEHPSASTSLAHVSQSSILQRRSMNTAKDDANESSFLMKRPDKKLSEIKLDFSGHKKLVGLATITDVMNDYANRMEQIRRQEAERAERRRKLESGEMDFDMINNNDEELVSLNVEAPSWSFLYKNKIESELEEQRLEREREFNARPPGARFPHTPSANILLLNKCRNLINWTFEDVWYFQGNIHLRNIRMPVFKVCLVYDPEMAYEDSEKYGVIRMKKIIPQFCSTHLSERGHPEFLLEVLELKSKLPTNLLPMCETSSNLSDFDEKLDELCINAQNMAKMVQEICKKSNALLKQEDGTIFILKTMIDFENTIYQDFIIELSDIDSTNWRNVRTNPHRTLNEDVKSLPKGIPFIEELLANSSEYVPWQ